MAKEAGYGAKTGGGGDSFTLGPSPNQFIAATRVDAENARIAQESDSSWLQNYIDDSEIGIYLIYADAAVNIVEPQRYIDGEFRKFTSFLGVKGDRGDGINFAAFPDNLTVPLIDTVNEAVVPSRARQTDDDIRLSGNVRLLDTVEARVRSVSSEKRVLNALTGSVTIARTQAGNNFVIRNGATVPGIELPPYISDPVSELDLYDGWFFTVRIESEDSTTITVNTLNGGALDGDNATLPGRSDNLIVFESPSSFRIQTTPFGTSGGGSNASELRGVAVPAPAGVRSQLTFIDNAYTWHELTAEAFIVRALVAGTGPHTPVPGEGYEIIISGSDCILNFDTAVGATAAIAVLVIHDIGNNKVVFNAFNDPDPAIPQEHFQVINGRGISTFNVQETLSTNTRVIFRPDGARWRIEI